MIAGRSAHLSTAREQQRWRWRAERVLVNSRPVHLLTYDQLYEHLATFLPLFSRGDLP